MDNALNKIGSHPFNAPICMFAILTPHYTSNVCLLLVKDYTTLLRMFTT